MSAEQILPPFTTPDGMIVRVMAPHAPDVLHEGVPAVEPGGDQTEVVVLSDSAVAVTKLGAQFDRYTGAADELAEAYVHEARYHATKAMEISVAKSNFDGKRRQLTEQATIFQNRVDEATEAEQAARADRDSAEIQHQETQGEYQALFTALHQAFSDCESRDIKNPSDVHSANEFILELAGKVQELASPGSETETSAIEQLLQRVLEAQSTLQQKDAVHQITVAELARAKEDLAGVGLAMHDLEAEFDRLMTTFHRQRRNVEKGGRRTRKEVTADRRTRLARIFRLPRANKPLEMITMEIES